MSYLTKKIIWPLFVSLFFSTTLWSFPCYLTLAKDNCWTSYDVTVNVFDATTDKVLTTITVSKGKSWGRQNFSCEQAQKLMFQAQFSPHFWHGDENKTYNGIDYRFMPREINAGDTAWNIPLCFAKDFAQIPLPPNASSECSCDFTTIPAVEPK